MVQQEDKFVLHESTESDRSKTQEQQGDLEAPPKYQTVENFDRGIPVLLKSMKIYRSPLPFSPIDSLSRRLLSEPLSPPCYLQAVFLSPVGGGRTNRIARLISEEVAKRTGSNPSCESCGRSYTILVVVDSGNGVCTWSSGDGSEGNLWFWPCGEVDVLGLRSDDKVLDEMLDSALRKGGCLGSVGGKIYTLVVVEGEGDEGVKIVLGKYWHAWVVGNVGESDVVSMITKIFVKHFVNGVREEDVVKRKGEFLSVGLDGNIVLSFSLLNANPNDWVYDWYD